MFPMSYVVQKKVFRNLLAWPKPNTILNKFTSLYLLENIIEPHTCPLAGGEHRKHKDSHRYLL